MAPTIELLIGSPVSGEKARFLKELFGDFNGQNVLILANFEANNPIGLAKLTSLL